MVQNGTQNEGQRLIDCLNIRMSQQQLIESITSDSEFYEVLEASVNFFASDQIPLKHENLIWLNKFLEAHLFIPEEDLMCSLWNRIGKMNSGLGQETTSMSICNYMNRSTIGKTFEKEKDRPIHILDPACGSGIFAVSAYNLFHKHAQWPQCWFQQVDCDLKCVYMTILNLLIRNFNAIVWHANALVGAREDMEKLNVPCQAYGLKSGKKISTLTKLSQEDSYAIWEVWYNRSDKKKENQQLTLFK